MKWQDRVFTLGGVVLTLSLLPSLFSNHKPAPLTSLITAITLFSFLFVYWSYNLKGALVLGAVTVVLWLVLFGQAI